MQISLRSQLVAGAVAIVGTSAIAIAPIAPSAVQLPSVHMPSVALTAAFADPIDAFLSSMQLVNNDVFNGLDSYAPYNMLQGILPQNLVMNSPVQTQMGLNKYSYFNTLIAGLVTADGSSLKSLGSMVWNLPAALLTAVQQVFGGDISGALATLSSAIIVPIQNAATSALLSIGYVATTIVTNLVQFIQTIPGIVGSLVDTGLGTAQVLADSATTAVTNVLGALQTFDIQGAWDAWVAGALSPAGYPGALEAMTLGPGVGAWGDPGYQSSIRVWVTGSIYAVANALGGNYPTAAAVAPAASLKSAAATEAPVSAPTPEITDNEQSSGPSADASSAEPTTASNEIGSSAKADDSVAGSSPKAGGNSKASSSDSGPKAGSASKSGGAGHRAHGSSRTAAKSGDAA